MTLNENIALFLEPNSHFLDHLGIFCSLFNIPALFSDPVLEKTANQYYPELKTMLISPSQINLGVLSKLAKKLYIPLYRYSLDFLKLEKMGLVESRPRFIYVPHGFSDKITNSDIMDHAHLDDFFIYGNQEKIFFEKFNLSPSPIFLGNFRHHFYEQKKTFYQKIIRCEIFQKFSNSRIFLYAPTWQDPRKPTAFFNVFEKLIARLPNDTSLLVKPHPLLYRYSLNKMLQLQQKVASNPSILLLDDYPLILPILANIDGLITDHSSIGYDFLPFNKPLFFILNDKKESTRLHECGHIISSQNLDSIFQSSTTNSNFKKAKSLYEHTFHCWDSLKQFKSQMKAKHFAI